MSLEKNDLNGATTVDVATYIDAQPVGGFQIRLLLTCAAVLVLDGFDTQAIGYTAPAIAAVIHLDRKSTRLNSSH